MATSLIFGVLLFAMGLMAPADLTVAYVLRTIDASKDRYARDDNGGKETLDDIDDSGSEDAFDPQWRSSSTSPMSWDIGENGAMYMMEGVLHSH